MKELALILLAALPFIAWAQSNDAPPAPGVPPPVSIEGKATEVIPLTGFIPDAAALRVPPPQQRLLYNVVIQNSEGGVIRIVDPPAQFLLARPGIDIGKVVRPATRLNTESFHASLWGKPLTVAASAVNAVHIKACDERDAPRAAVITLLPAELLERELDGRVAVMRDDSIYTDIPGGKGIFGGAYPVIVGNPAVVYRGRQRVTFNRPDAALETGDVIVIEVRVPETWPRRLTIDNRHGGQVTILDANGNNILCGRVDKPVSGTGRFEGGVFCCAGGIRATHNGVLDVDFSPPEDVGGMQFIPHAHSLSPELTYSQASPPYGILTGPDGSDLRGQAPLFSGYLYPESGLEAPVKLPRLLVSVEFSSGNARGGDAIEVESDGTCWLPLPSLIGRKDLSDLVAIRIDWLTEGKDQGIPVAAAAPPPAQTPDRNVLPAQPRKKAPPLKGYTRPARPPRGHNR